MTAEVAILNSSAIAIAADSAVTIGRGRKIYNSAIKVFTLSKIAPVGIMVYGNAGLLEVPWETIIKIYRAELKDHTFPRLEDYAAHLIDFLPKQDRFFPKELQDTSSSANIYGYFAAIRDDVLRVIERRIKQHGKVDDAETARLFKTTIARHHEDLAKAELVHGATKRWESALRRKLAGVVPKLITDVFQKLPLDADDRKLLLEVSSLIHSRAVISADHSGVVICGFGEQDIYPALVTNLIDGVYDGRLKFKQDTDKTFRVSEAHHCSIIPFAQDDMVATFMEGINPSVNRFTNRYLQQLFARLPELLLDEDLLGDDDRKREVRKKLGTDARELLKGFLDQLGTHKDKEHVAPILDMVQVLPKDELAEMAEALVNLTAFKRRMTDELETVGGPVDVAVISKGDGLVWVKRKHYFKPELNQQFFANYYRGVNGGKS